MDDLWKTVSDLIASLPAQGVAVPNGLSHITAPTLTRALGAAASPRRGEAVTFRRRRGSIVGVHELGVGRTGADDGASAPPPPPVHRPVVHGRPPCRQRP